MIVRLLVAALLTASACASAVYGECGSAISAAVPDATTARLIALAVIAAHQKPNFSARYVLKVGPDGTKGWIAFQEIPPVAKLNGDMLVTPGGGGIGMHIDRCSGAISQLHYQK